MDAIQGLSLQHFLSHADGVSKTILLLMLLASISSWYLILTKAWADWRCRRRSAKFLEFFWNAPSLREVAIHLDDAHPQEPFSHLAYHGIAASRHHERHGVNRLNEAGSASDFVTRTLRKTIDEETAKMESGLTVLASVGSTAPFVGLLGTVWGIFHALVAIGVSGAGTLDKVAGPVGEALIMTAIGLAVAIPAVLGYNFLVRANRVTLSQLDAFAHDLFAFLATGVKIDMQQPGAQVAPLKSAAQRS
ncbi:outer membrane transport energization protein ExbB (TC 2.C.1.1.1) [Solimonas aquatica]|uniref:Biopolymer transport protein ExbB n=1 Tax=Solimonas aquatica TaxID=489703 RepID=A0A1H9CIX7_9GAMM|nr:MotA/TolQ/ExbB proton channel family protein [Solimonas aquatica]SEQ01166.1 outer membrane transport energization protein ExbB (TC 2.C.1.1.1) [Solimonas aquatica]